ncbi:hypothetical protein Q5752_001377 [Cryptotrichosporon argae]
MYTYEYVSDFFAPATWEADLAASFGLAQPHTWDSFAAAIDELAAACPPNERVIVIYAARHAQGEHNAMANLYPELGEHAQIAHPIRDARLTPLGRLQAITVGAALAREAGAGMPRPARWFVSPLHRAAETCRLEWAWACGADGPPAVVVEEIREHLHVHACDARSSTSSIAPEFPTYDWSRLSEDDELWAPGRDDGDQGRGAAGHRRADDTSTVGDLSTALDRSNWSGADAGTEAGDDGLLRLRGGRARGRETEDEMERRLERGMEEILDVAGNATYLSITAHSGALRALYAVLGAPARDLVVGELNVLVVRVKTA